MIPRTILFVVYLLLFTQPVSLTSTCGSLITYRQFTSIISEAPACFRQGCGNELLESLSSKCGKTSSCYELHSTISNHTGLHLCDDCHGDIACRTHGWPILNATELCQSIPPDWMMLDENCCGDADETVQIASWIKELCTDEWRHGFTHFGGMAKDDWQEWIMPWNWTVQAVDGVVSGKNIHKCHSPSYYLLYFAVESWITCFSILFFQFVKIKWHYAHDRWEWGIPEYDPPFGEKYHGTKDRVRMFVLSFKNGLKWPARFWGRLRGTGTQESQDTQNGEDTEASRKGPGRTIVMACLMVVIEIGTTFLNAWLLRTAPGFENFDWVRLGFLWCSRPSLAWLTSVVGTVRSSKLSVARFKNGQMVVDNWQANLFIDTAYSSILNEFVVQILGAVYLGYTTNKGQEREFYKSHRLSPFYRGPHARQMYIGSLIWMMAFPIAIIIWGVVTFRLALLLGLGTALQHGLMFLQKAKRIVIQWWSSGVKMLQKSIERLGRCCWAAYRGRRRGPPRWRPPNRGQRFINKYIVRGGIRRWLNRHLHGRLRGLVEYLLRAKLGDIPRLQLSRSQSVHYHQPGVSNGASNDLLQLPYCLPEFVTPQESPESTWDEPAPRSTPYIENPFASSQDIVSDSSHMSIAIDPEETQWVPASRVSSVPSDLRTGTAMTSDRMNVSYLDAIQRRRFNPTPTIGTSGYDTIQLYEPSISDPSTHAPSTRSNPFDDGHAISVEPGPSVPLMNDQDTSYRGHRVGESGIPEISRPPSNANPASSKPGYLDRRIAELEAQFKKKRTPKLLRDYREPDIRELWMTFVLSTGCFLYISQWLFWDGFVKASGERYCPPNVIQITRNWALAIFTAVGAIFFGNG
ncbi:uncharacterized protein BDR25DRAFT_46527 [Lindgomyces ingoldianus]|uniref:Uncharacterized protein n=1 Tax=Lindgomyces ingoldianus TaxID=673940 RepID=A0ACB6QS02_9PLEO|nr:uncharacterized protein BDR25DRAFT_46527 [Lindgomyces ingoldianus]KAF2469622.1 hypothetical protein BDR25DRAFT_46527 [Lindgomyces ingoldianus]